ncbi:MAG: cupin-like domain-containing protein [Alphaproteobacteria bacterium]|nr:cupin-like domain-containing protein [Alphaproteobacteria bacterium]MCB9694624.1 cupin-like domain-containing protein [Alphaproteobacteria bacterium]
MSLSDAWVAWIAGSLLRRQSEASIVAALVEEGLTEARAREEVAAVAASPVLAGAELAVSPFRRASLLRRTVLRTADRDVPRIPAGPLYLEAFAVTQTPVVLEGATAHWPTWTWGGLRARFGDREVTALVDRDSRPEHDRDHAPHVRAMPFSALIDRCLDPATGNDVYATARNELAKGALADLVGELPPLPGIVPDPARGTGLLVGAAGATTALHYDISTVLLCQQIGRKRVWLVAPEEDVEESAATHWAEPFDLDAPGRAVREVVVSPGDALSIPAGWWHAAVALDPCVTVTLAGLAVRSNRHDWLAAR